MTTKYADGKEGIRWKWFEERGFRILADRHQYAYLQALFADRDDVQGVFCNAPAGTGKTTLAIMAGAYEVLKGNYDRIIYIRNAVSVREGGFLPGTDKEKDAPYMQPAIDAMENVQPGMYEKWIGEERLICITTTYTRGVNWNNAFIIMDEAQNFDMHELQTAHTRPGGTSKVVTIGSTRQVDNKKLKRIAGLTPFEIMALHFRGKRASFHKLVNNYRGEWSRHADEVGETIRRIEEEGLEAFGETFIGADPVDHLLP